MIGKERKSLKEKLLQIGSKTTLNAIPSILLNERVYMKVLWTIGLIVSASFCCQFVIDSFNDYFKYEVNTVLEVVKDKEANFPTITFCNMQICGFKDYNFQTYLSMYKTDEQNKFGSSQNDVIDEKLRKNNTKTSYFSAKEVFLRKYNDTDLVKILNKNKTSIKSMLISCLFDGQQCDENDFEFFSIGEFQKCYKFNSGTSFNGSKIPIKNSKRFGQNTGLQIELYIGSQNECKSPLSSTAGLTLYVHNSTYTLTEEDNAIDIKPGTEAAIAIDRTFVKKLANPFSDCYENDSTTTSDLIQRTINYTGIYTQQYCLQLCYQDFLIEFCDCYDHTLPNFSPKDYKACPKFIDSLYNCQYLIKRLFYNGKNDEHCLKDCPKECDYISYSTTISYSKFPSESYQQILTNTNLTRSVLELPNDIVLNNPNGSSVLSVNAFYISSSYTKINEQPALNLGIFFSNIGGTLGLFLGISALAVIEILEVIIEMIFTPIENLGRREKKI